MSPELGSGDSGDLKAYLCQLEANKLLLTKRLSDINEKNKELNQRLDRIRDKSHEVNGCERQTTQQLVRLRDQSMILELNAQRLESNIEKSRFRVQQLREELIDKRNKQSFFIDQFTQEMDSLNKQFSRLASIHNCQQLDQNCQQLDQIRDIELEQKIRDIDEEIRDKRQKRSSLIQTLSQMEDNSQRDGQSNESIDGLEYKWKHWPIQHRMIALEIFIDENRLLTEDIESQRTSE